MNNDGWVKLIDPNSGRTFYANKITKVTQWDPPPEFLDEPVKKSSFSSSSSSVVTTHSDLPPNWEKLHDDASGRDFYVNHLTKQTQWEHPGGGGAGNKHEISNQNIVANRKETSVGLATGFGFIPSPRNDSVSTPSSNHSNALKEKPSHHSSTWDTNHLPPSNAFRQGSLSSKEMPSAYKLISFVSNDDQSSKYYKGVGPNSLKPIDFKVVQVSNLLRSSCPSCDTIFSISKRRHHCRLCGDIFCDHCSNKKVLLPLAGHQYDKPVRVCDSCYVDVEKGNYFSMRRYLTPLLLYNPEHEESVESYTKADDSDDESETITIKNVAAALTSMAQDLDALLLDSSLYSEKMTIGADVLVPAISRHLKSPETADRAIRTLGNLLALGGIVDDTSYVAAFYLQQKATSYMNDVMTLLEWSGSSMKTIAVQEQSVKVLLSLSDPKVIQDILDLEESSGHNHVSILDIHRTMRSMLDHVTNTASPALQRWASACIRHLVAEDYRRAIDAISEAMILGLNELKYKTVIGDIITSGGTMILSSLLSSENSDARENAISALSAIIFSSREISTRIGIYKDAYQVSSIEVPSEVSVIESIFSYGACGSLGHLLASADNQVAKMGCEFAKTLVSPLITEPSGSNMVRYHRLFLNDPNSILLTTEDKLSVYRRVCLEIGSSDGIIGALIHIINDHSTTHAPRPEDLKLCSMEVLAAISIALADFDCKAKLSGGLADEKIQHQIAIAFSTLEEERVGDALLSVFSRTGVGSLNTSRDTKFSQLQEMSALAISALAPCSESFAADLMGNHILTPLISISLDEGYFQHSYRGEWAQRRLPMLEATASLLAQSWKIMQYESLKSGDSFSTTKSESMLNFFFEALDGGVIRLLTSALNSPSELSESPSCISDLRLKCAGSHICASIFGLGICDGSGLALSRLFEALGTAQRLIPQVMYLLEWIGKMVQSHSTNRSSTVFNTLLSHLQEAVILAAGSICGSPVCSFISLQAQKDNMLLAARYDTWAKYQDVFSDQFKEICTLVSDILSKLSGFVTSSLVGAFGEGSVTPVLRLLAVIAVSGNSKVIQQLVRSGVISPLCDMVKGAILSGDYYTFSVIVDAIANIGVEVSSNSEQLNSLRECVKLLSNLLAIQKNSNSNPDILTALKHKCIITIGILSGNSSLWNTIVANFVPLYTEKYLALLNGGKYSKESISLIRAGLQVIIRVVAVPSHATFVANTGLAPIISSFVSEDNLYSSDERMAEVECQAVEILHALLEQSTKQAATGQLDPGMVNLYAYDAACVILSRDRFFSIQSATKLTRLGLRMVEQSIIFLRSIPKQDIPRSPMILTFVDSAIRHKAFIKRLCASVFEKSVFHQTLPEKSFSPQSMYGDPFALLLDDSSNKNVFLDAVIQIMFYLIFYGSLVQTESADVLWKMIMLSDMPAVEDHVKKTTGEIALLCVLLYIFDKNDPRYAADSYHAFALPIVRSRLVYMLSITASEYSKFSLKRLDSIDEIHKILVYYRVPQTCLELTADDSLLPLAFDALQYFFKGFPECLLSTLVSEANSLKELMDMLNRCPGNHDDHRNQKETLSKMNIFSAAVLSSAAEFGILGQSVNSLGLRNVSIASLISGCLSENELAEEFNDVGATMSELCLRALLDVVSSRDSKSQEKTIIMSDSEATLISSALGSKLSSLTLDRFVLKASQQIEEFDVTKFSEVKLLCALTASTEALDQLCSNGGLEALSLIAAEGDITTINALTEISKTKPSAVLGVDGHVSVMQVLSKKKSDASSENACLTLLMYLCRTSDGLEGVCLSEECDSCVLRTCEIVHSSIESCCVDDDHTKTSLTTETFEFKREVSALRFLTCILSNDKKRQLLLSDFTLRKSIETLSRKATDVCLQHAALIFLSAYIRVSIIIHDLSHDADSDCDSILSIINSNTSRRSRGHIGKVSGFASFGDFGESRQYNDNLIIATCFQILEALIESASEKIRLDILESIESCWKQALQAISLQKKAIGRNRNAGLMMNNMMRLCSVAVTQSKTREWVANNDGFLSDLLQLITSNPMTENVANEDDALRIEQTYWRSSVSHALHVLALITQFPSRKWSSVLSEIYDKTVSSHLIAVRQQKNPTVDDVLMKFVNGSEHSSASAVLRILENIKL